MPTNFLHTAHLDPAQRLGHVMGVKVPPPTLRRGRPTPAVTWAIRAFAMLGVMMLVALVLQRVMG